MAQEIDLGGTIYISSKKAAEITGYAQDYIGQLARAGHISAQRVSGHWYVVEKTLRDYKARADEFKPEPPKYERPHDVESAVSFDGKDYVSAQRAAKITGYHQDYVGQLARSGKIVSRQIGNRWYIDRNAIVEHKKHTDALLAAVQVEAVGLSKDPVQDAVTQEPLSEGLHFTYTQPVEGDLMPITKASEEESRQDEVQNTEISEDDIKEVVTDIPIRIVKEDRRQASSEMSRAADTSVNPSYGIWAMVGVGLIIIAGLIGGYWFVSGTSATPAQTPIGKVEEKIPDLGFRRIAVPDFLLNIVSKTIEYRRDGM